MLTVTKVTLVTRAKPVPPPPMSTRTIRVGQGGRRSYGSHYSEGSGGLYDNSIYIYMIKVF